MIEFFQSWGYLGLFLGSFLASTVVPFSADALIIGMLVVGGRPWLCFLLATIGNWLGGMTSFAIGWIGKWEWIEKYLHVKKEKLDQAERFMADRGAWMGFFAFIPILGSAITIVLGLTRANIIISTISITIGKVLRYILLVYGLSFIV